jgi:cytidine kinase
MSNLSLLRYVIAGRLCRNYVITPQGKALLDVPGGSLFHAAAGMGIWETGIGLIGRVGEDYPQEWLERVAAWGFDTRGVRILPEALDLRHFIAYSENNKADTDNPVMHFSRLEMPFPKRCSAIPRLQSS